jgi:uncharacterized membrane protein
MNKTRLEAFSDGVLAIIITIMVLEIKVPHDTDWHSLQQMIPVFFSYVLSFVFVGIYWGNHHHLLHSVKRVSSSIIWANLHLLFWLSLVPFVTAWMGENRMQTNTIVAYAVVLLMDGIAFTILQLTIEKSNPFNEKLKAAYKKVRTKGIFSMIAYASSIAFAFVNTYISCFLIVLVAAMWVVPDRHIEDAVKDSPHE